MGQLPIPGVFLLLIGCWSTMFAGSSPGDQTGSGLSTISASRTVALEQFTGTWCPPCVDAALALKELQSEYSRDQVAMVEYHFGYGGMSDPYEPKDGTTQERYSFYGGESNLGAPGAVFDGDHANPVNGASSVQEVKARYKARIDSRLAWPAPVEIVALASYSGASASFSVTVNPVGQLGSTAATIRGVLVEDISTTEQGHWIGWAARATVMVESVALTQPRTETSSSTLDPSWRLDRLALVAYAQLDSDGSIANSRFTRLVPGGAGDGERPVIAAVSHSPATPTELERVAVSATITDNVAVASATLSYDDGSGPKGAGMSSSGPSFRAEIGPFAAGASVSYHVGAVDPSGNAASSTTSSFTVRKATTADKVAPVIGRIAMVPLDPVAGDPVTITATVTDDVALGSVKLWHRSAGGSGTVAMSDSGVSYSTTIGPFAAGESVRARVLASDTSGNQAESDEINFTVKATAVPMDLSISPGSLSISPSPAVAGRAATLSLSVRNPGPSTASDIVVRVDGPHGFRVYEDLPRIAPGTAHVVEVRWVPSKPGDALLTAILDPERLQPDPDRSNNAASLTVDVVTSGPGGGIFSASPTSMLLAVAVIGTVAVTLAAVAQARRRRRARRAGYDPDYPLRSS